MRIQLRNLRSLAPFIGGVFTYGIYRILYSEAGINGIGRDFEAIILELRSTDVLGGVDSIHGLLSWSVTGTFFILSFLGGVAVLLHILYEASRGLSDLNRYLRFAVSLSVVAAIGFLTFSGNPFAVDSLNRVLENAFALHGIEGARILYDLSTPMVLAVTVLLMVSAWATLKFDTASANDAVLTIKTRLRWLNRTLFVGAVVLVAGVVHADAVHRLPSVLMIEVNADAWNELIGALSASSGAIWTFLLLGIYLPSIVVLRLRVRALAEDSVEQRTPEHVENWLKNHGLTVQFPQMIAQVGAIISPFLVGGPASPLIGLFGG
ncbi:MAG: hypothetical protein QNI99_09905 [Woeseiaceae bacterium]|nr:hypothetical protein [Woeseiaceae bacterium]